MDVLSRGGILYVCYCDMFSVVNVYLDHLKFCVMCINGRKYVCCGECYVVSNECDGHTSCLVQPIVAHCCEVMYFGCFGFLNWDDICMCVVNKQFYLLESVFDSFMLTCSMIRFLWFQRQQPTSGGTVKSSDLQIVVNTSLQTVSSTVFRTRVSLQRLS